MIKLRLLLISVIFVFTLTAQQLVYNNASPVGTKNGTNRIFTLETSPNPIESLKLYKNGLRLLLNTDYVLSANTITYQVAPISSDVLLADYEAASVTSIELLPNLVTTVLSPSLYFYSSLARASITLPPSNPANIAGITAVSNEYIVTVIEFSPTINERIHIPITFPDGWIGDLSIKLIFKAACTGNISFQARTGCIPMAGDEDSLVWNSFTDTESIPVDGSGGMQLANLVNIPVSSCQQGFWGLTEIVRDSEQSIRPATVDNCNTDAHVIHVEVRYTYNLDEL